MIKYLIISFLFFVLLIVNPLRAQKVEKITIPQGIVYNYCKVSVYEESKLILTENLQKTDGYDMVDDIMIIGPTLWERYQNVESLKKIEGGNTILLVDDKKLSAKLTQSMSDSKKVWDQLRQEVDGTKYLLRKAKPEELKYYWTVISFDIEEPLIILETDEIKYLLNLNPKTLKILWLDQVPE